MSNAAKHRKKAAEFEQLKQIDRAIASYIRAVEESETEGADVDVALLNKVGDLTLRQGRVADAVTYYERAVEHYATAGLFNNAIALCNKILRSAPGRSNVYFTLGRICAKKGLRGDATRNFLEYATRMQQEGRVDEGMRALAEVADLMPELTEVRRLVEEHADRAGIVLPRRRTPVSASAAATEPLPRFDNKSSELVFLDLGAGGFTKRNTPPLAPRVQTPARSAPATSGPRRTPIGAPSGGNKVVSLQTQSLEDFMLFDPNRDTPTEPLRPITPLELPVIVVNHHDDDASVEPVQEPIFAPIALVPDLVIEPLPDKVIESPVEAVAEIVFLAAVDTAVEPPLEAAVETPVEAAVETPVEATVEAPSEAAVEAPVEAPTDIVVDEVLPFDEHVEPPEGLESIEDVASVDVDVPEGFASGEFDPTLAANETELDGLIVEDFEHVADDPQALVVTGSTSGTPTYGDDATLTVTPLEVSPIPELDAAIEAGELTAALADADPELTTCRPPFRLDPHDFILPGELPPLLVEDELVFAGMQFAIDAVDDALTSTGENHVDDVVASPDAFAWSDEEPNDASTVALDAEPSTTNANDIDASHDESGQSPEAAVEVPVEASVESPVDASVEATPDVDDLEAETHLREVIEADHAVRSTPSLHIAAVAAEANAVATSRRDELHAAVSRAPHDWVLRRRLAEALFEVGERERGLSELQVAVSGFAQAGDLAAAADIADQLVRLAPERIPYHQKRVELAVRLSDQLRLRAAYLDLGDMLVQMGDEVRAHAVYARVLEIDPWDERARAALGSAAPPPPPPAPEPASDEFVSLAEWLQDDEPGTTRMRMREPKVSGDEQADFDSLLRHFKEGVARSLGDEDCESHYDLGVAYKEMGLLDDAISEFQKALRSRRHRLPAYEALGQCFVEQSRHSVAATVLSRAVHEPGPGDEHRVGVLYLLAYSCEALQRWDEARSYYSRVYATDIHFRDVAARLAALDLVAR